MENGISKLARFIFNQIFVKLVGNQDRHKISDEFEFRLDGISHFGVMCPWGQIKFPLLIMQYPRSVDLSDENILGSLWAQLRLQFSTDCFETFQMFSAWNEEMHVVWIWFFDNFFSLFLLCELRLFFFSVWNAIKVGTLWAQLLLQFSFNCFETLQMFSEWNEDVHVVWV